MSSPVITQRNRANATHSTGPVTAEGKARSSQNALKLGLSLQRHVILPTEDPAEFAALHADLLRIYCPKSEREELAVQEIAHCRWAFRRFDAAEVLALTNPILDVETGEPIDGIAPLNLIAAVATNNGKPHPRWSLFHNLTRYRGHWERRHQRAIAEFDRACISRLREARERRQQERHQMAEERQRMARERRDRTQTQRTPGKPRPNPVVNPLKTREHPQSGFVPYSTPQSDFSTPQPAIPAYQGSSCPAHSGHTA